MSKLFKAKDEPICAEPKHLHLPTVFAPDTTNFSVVVENPRKVGDKNAFVAYTVKCTRTAENTTTVVDRRYSDFDWLCEHLKAAHPSCVVPQIPEKSFSGNFDEGLMAFRARELTRFLQRVLSHPLMSSDEAVQCFVTAEESEFAQRRSQKQPKEGFLTTLKRAAATVVSSQEDPDSWFADKADDVLKREVLLTQMLQTVQKMINQYQQLIRAIDAHLGSLHEFMTSLEDDGLKTVLEKNCEAFEETKEVMQDMLCQLSVTLSGNILDYIHELQAINSLLERRAPLLKAFLSAQKDSTSSPSAEASAKCDEAQAQYDQFSNAARADIQRACDIRRGDMDRFFAAISHYSQEYYNVLAGKWATALGAKVTAPREPRNTDGDDGAFAGTATTTTTSVYGDAML